MESFATAREHLEAELRRLDLLIHREILRLRTSYQLSLDEFRGLYISNEQVDDLIKNQSAFNADNPSVETLTYQAAELRGSIAARMEGDLPWQRLVIEFGLSRTEADILLITLAPELNLKYETLYAYLNNDVTRKWPTIDLAARLTDSKRRLAQDSPLFTSGLLQLLPPAAERLAWPATSLSVTPMVADYILGATVLDNRLAEFCQLRKDLTIWEGVPVGPQRRLELQRASELLKAERYPWLIFLGRQGSGRRAAAEAVSADLKRPLLQVDLLAAGSTPQAVPSMALQARLYHCVVYLPNSELLFDREGNPLPESYLWLRVLNAVRQPVILGLTAGCDWRQFLQGRPALPFQFELPGYEERIQLWSGYLGRGGFSLAESDLISLANHFPLSSGQIQEAVNLAITRQTVRGEVGQLLRRDTLLEAARETSGQSLCRLAVKLETKQSWQDLILPTATLRQAHEVTAAIRNYHLVYDQWGFGGHLSRGRGVKVLFSGASGTGKTMTAGVIARELGLDIYKIDLSGVVSKYIGETEKNLERIFQAAESSNAILFFDEADALFGKRSEVKDAHDRYANIEVAYLLQRIEEFEGVVILASNLGQNIDEAFARRMHYVIEFPMPGQEHREQLWRGMFPSQAPLGEDVDFPFLAKQFSLSGGDIRNVSLDAAFLAAQNGRVIRMQHLVCAMARQMMKQGKPPSATDFKQYYELIV